MNRAQRRAHARVWPVLVLMLIAIVGASLIVRERLAERSAEISAKRAP